MVGDRKDGQMNMTPWDSSLSFWETTDAVSRHWLKHEEGHPENHDYESFTKSAQNLYVCKLYICGCPPSINSKILKQTGKKADNQTDKRTDTQTNKQVIREQCPSTWLKANYFWVSHKKSPIPQKNDAADL